MISEGLKSLGSPQKTDKGARKAAGRVSQRAGGGKEDGVVQLVLR